MEEESVRRIRRQYKDVRRHVVQLIIDSKEDMRRLEHRLLDLGTCTNTETVSETQVSPRIEQCITDAWRGKNVFVMVSKIGPYKVFFFDLYSTSPGLELESEVINAFIYLEIQKFNIRSAEQAFYIDSFEMRKIWRGHLTMLKQPIDFSSDEESVNNLRKHIAVTLLQDSDDLTRLCSFCGEESGDTAWISCLSCLRRYHRSCVQPSSLDTFVCAACKD
ncbi:unnamed protein product [Leuciscus chuanchicus]